MNEKKEGIAPPANIGISMMLVVFLVMCLFTFSAIALVQAQNEYNNALRTSGLRSAYYDAVNTCETDLHQLNASIRATAAGASPSIERNYEMTDDMAIYVVFTLVPDGGYYHITKFQTVSTTTWSGNDKLDLVQ
ncbi:MAG: hypothetical protein IJT32_06085 [Lachnospiraceae bacterium]|nr:hypothetical protein [Lachnospiraceae bacterium]